MEAMPSMNSATPMTPAFVPAQGRQRDGPGYSDSPPLGAPRPRPRGGRHTGCPPIHRPPRRRTAPDARARPQGGTRPQARHGGNGTGPPPPQNKPRDRGRKHGGARTAWNGPTGALHRNHATCARHADPGREAGSGRRESASPHTRKGHLGNTRRATGTSPWNAQTAWNGVPAGEGKGNPDGTTRHMQRGERRAGGGEWGRPKTRHRPQPPRPAASAAHTPTGHCTRQGSSGSPSNAPAPRLGSLCASPRGAHWRQASSTGPAVPASRVTTH